MSPTRRVALLAAGLAALSPWVDGGLLVLGALVLAGVCIGDALSVRRPPRVERTVPSTLSRGVAAPLLIRVLDGDRAGRVTVRQPVPPGFAVTPDRATDTIDAVVVGHVRGRHELPALAVRSIGRLGLGRWDHRVGESHPVAVYPDLPAARNVVNAVRHGLARDLAQLTRGALGLGTELERVRDYLPDDEVRQINWKATARMGRPMSNEYRLDEDRDVVCIVDMGRLMAAPTGPSGPRSGGHGPSGPRSGGHGPSGPTSGEHGPLRNRLDVACDAVASVALVADDVGDRIGSIAFDGEIRRLVKPRRRGGRAVIDSLFDVTPSASDSDHLTAFHAVGGGKRACVVVFTDLVDVAAARSMVDAMPILARRHAVVVATVTDDDIVELLRRPPETAVDVHAAAIAVDVLGARAAAVASLRDAGAVVVEAPAGMLGRACVGAYLTLKARARL